MAFFYVLAVIVGVAIVQTAFVRWITRKVARRRWAGVAPQAPKTGQMLIFALANLVSLIIADSLLGMLSCITVAIFVSLLMWLELYYLDVQHIRQTGVSFWRIL